MKQTRHRVRIPAHWDGLRGLPTRIRVLTHTCSLNSVRSHCVAHSYVCLSGRTASLIPSRAPRAARMENFVAICVDVALSRAFQVSVGAPPAAPDTTHLPRLRAVRPPARVRCVSCCGSLRC